MNDSLKEKFIETLTPFKEINLLMHNFIDPDAIGACLGLLKIIKVIWPEKKVRIYGHGVSQPQNKTIIRVLNINIIDPAESPPKTTPTIGNIFVDFNPSSTNFDYPNIHPIWCIDHHVDLVDSIDPHLFCDIRAVGATCTIVYDYISSLGIALDPEAQEDQYVAIAMVMGIKIDTKDLLSEKTTPKDYEVYQLLRKYCDLEKLKEIIRYTLPPYYYDKIELSCTNKKIIDSVLVINLGFLEEDQRDVIAFIADLWSIRKGTEVFVVVAVISETSEVIASVRTVEKSSITAKDLVRGLFKTGGGHPEEAGAQVKLDWLDPKYLTNEVDRNKWLDVLTSIILTKTCLLTGTK